MVECIRRRKENGSKGVWDRRVVRSESEVEAAAKQRRGRLGRRRTTRYFKCSDYGGCNDENNDKTIGNELAIGCDGRDVGWRMEISNTGRRNLLQRAGSDGFDDSQCSPWKCVGYRACRVVSEHERREGSAQCGEAAIQLLGGSVV